MYRYFEINGRGHNVRCKLYYQDLHAVKRVVIFCHGFGGHKDNTAAETFANRMLSKGKGMAMVTFNWPCHGDDVKKKLCLEDCDSYLTLVLDHIRSRFQPQEIYAYATSFGGYLTLKYILEHGNPFRKIALRCPAINMHQVLTGIVAASGDQAKLQKGKDILVGFDRKIPVGSAFLNQLQENDIRDRDFLDYAEDILILHGTADEIVPFAVSRDFSENNLVELLPVEGADHRFRDKSKMDQAIGHILAFFSV